MRDNNINRHQAANRYTTELRLRFRDLRRENGLSQAKLGELIGVDQATISNFESGRTVMSVKQAYEMALIFDIELA
ncbi:helix-turn-helix transcriptional regulator [Pseudoalteromonas sp. MMG022]|uniref:helix-turn-helix transcriptional regulator n=1 Tax=Pseudoalteromonas sp. MMG022 TaxID=2909978 RepID=UPI001F323ACC|nr:helix-turn-helix transcriptional regulator [Pseudoalteromonas sp. MMG022]MCF6437608.1 helix-turn-helix transcriptional regulator [Pseudoalteromonas sp. MMG022]